MKTKGKSVEIIDLQRLAHSYDMECRKKGRLRLEPVIDGIRKDNDGNIYDIYLNLEILKNGAKTNMIRIRMMHAHPLATSDLGL